MKQESNSRLNVPVVHTTRQEETTSKTMLFVEERKIGDDTAADADKNVSDDNNQTNSIQSPTHKTISAVSLMDTSWECISHALSEVLEGNVEGVCTISGQDANCVNQSLLECGDNATSQSTIHESECNGSVVIRPPRDKRGARTLSRDYIGGQYGTVLMQPANIEDKHSAESSNVELRTVDAPDSPYRFKLNTCSPPPGIASSSIVNKHRSLTSTLPLILEGDTPAGVYVPTSHPNSLRELNSSRYSLRLAESSKRKLNGLLDQSNSINTYRHSIASLNELSISRKCETIQDELSADLDCINSSQPNANKGYRPAMSSLGQQHLYMPSMQVNHLMSLLSGKLCNLDESSSSIDKKLDLYEYHCRKKLEDSREQLRKRIDELVETCGKKIDDTISDRRRWLQILERNIENHLTATQSIIAQAKLNMNSPAMSPDELHNINNMLLDCLVRTKKFQRESNNFNYWLDFVPNDPLDSDDCIGFLRFTETVNPSLISPPEITPVPEEKPLPFPTGQQQHVNSANMSCTSIHDTFTAVQPKPQGACIVSSNNRYSLQHEIPVRFPQHQIDPSQLMLNPVNQTDFYHDERAQTSHQPQSENDVLLRRPPMNVHSKAIDNSSRIYLNRRNSWHPMIHSSQPYGMSTYKVGLNEPAFFPSTMYPALSTNGMSLTAPTQETQHHIQQNTNNISSYQSANNINWLTANPSMVMGQPILVPAGDFINSSSQILSRPPNNTILNAQNPLTRACMQFQSTAISPNFNPNPIQPKMGFPLDDSNVAGRSYFRSLMPYSQYL